MRIPPLSRHRKQLIAGHEGIVSSLDNRRLARLAKLAGAPTDKAAGVEMHVRVGDKVAHGAPLCTLHADTPGELAYALNFADANLNMFEITAS